MEFLFSFISILLFFLLFFRILLLILQIILTLLKNYLCCVVDLFKRYKGIVRRIVDSIEKDIAGARRSDCSDNVANVASLAWHILCACQKIILLFLFFVLLLFVSILLSMLKKPLFLLLLLFLGVSVSGVSLMFAERVVTAQYCAEPISFVSHIRTQVGLYQYEHGCLPFCDAEVGTVTTWLKTDDEIYKPVHFELKAEAANNILSLLEMPLSDMMGRRLSPDQIQIACLAPGGVSEDGATTNAHAYAVGVFGSGESDRLPKGTGYVVMEAFFPDVVTTNEAGVAKTGFKLVATWKDYNKGENPIRFGYAGESYASDVAVCPLIPPEAFAPGAVTKLRGDGPDSVEYWVERLRDSPCGRWAYSLP